MSSRTFTLALILVGYAATLAVSAGHLAEWYSLTLGTLPRFLALALAVTLEMNAFLLSLLSNSILRGSRWATGGALVALGLVWLGNFRSMQRAGEGLEPMEVFAMSLFVPVGTYVMGKVVGELLREGAKPKEAPAEAPPVLRPALPQEEEEVASALLQTLERPMTLREIYQALPSYRQRLPEALKTLQERGLVKNERGFWSRAQAAQAYQGGDAR